LIQAEELLKLGQQLLKDRGIPSHVLDARILLATTLNLSQKYFLPNIEISNSDQVKFLDLIKTRGKGKPISRILSYRGFWDSEFYINSSTLDPRPDSEVLVSSAIELAKSISEEKLSVLELGVGSGCILLSILKEVSNSFGVGVDISYEAIKVAQKNSNRLNLENRVRFIVSNWTNSLNTKFNLIISNPPYIKSSEIQYLQKEVKDHDPLIALDGGNDGLNCYKLIFKNIDNYMTSESFLLFEIEGNRSDELIKISKNKPLSLFCKKKDLSGKMRCLIFHKKK